MSFKDFFTSLTTLFDSRSLCDVTVVAGDNHNATEFRAHSCILWARSEYFRKRLTEMRRTFQLESTKIRIESIESQVFAIILRFMYTNRLPLPPPQPHDYIDLLIASDVLQMEALASHIQDRMLISSKKWIKENFDRDDVSGNDVKDDDVNEDGMNKDDAKKDGANEAGVNEDEVDEDEVNENKVNKNEVNRDEVNEDEVNEDEVNEDEDEMNEDEVEQTRKTKEEEGDICGIDENNNIAATMQSELSEEKETNTIKSASQSKKRDSNDVDLSAEFQTPKKKRNKTMKTLFEDDIQTRTSFIVKLQLRK
ncbi:4833_t:CDS:2 [Paraglomus brasilianum]|uniref:4833_t:CDS:1 n=1 Tax=Paraglomus brasilianum TaxID=144538 RepID=A0A9N9F2Q9_9GLOM|nr:4833_t:CDS:2 [Paraglomus brasilianum]